MKSAVALALALGLVTIAPDARAQQIAPASGQQPVTTPSGLTPAEPGAQGTTWYGAHVLGADLATVLLGLGTMNIHVLLLGPVATGPAIHLLHGNPGRALGSLALRAGLPLAAALFHSQVLCDGGERGWCDRGGTMGVGIVSMIVVSGMDATFLAEKVIKPRPASDRVTVAPSVSTLPSGGLMIGLGGAF